MSVWMALTFGSTGGVGVMGGVTVLAGSAVLCGSSAGIEGWWTMGESGSGLGLKMDVRFHTHQPAPAIITIPMRPAIRAIHRPLPPLDGAAVCWVAGACTLAPGATWI